MWNFTRRSDVELYGGPTPETSSVAAGIGSVGQRSGFPSRTILRGSNFAAQVEQ